VGEQVVEMVIVIRITLLPQVMEEAVVILEVIILTEVEEEVVGTAMEETVDVVVELV
jgi:hypothetical protein